jgi:hypothetical protein
LLFHPGLAANQEQAVETHSLWNRHSKQHISGPCKLKDKRHKTSARDSNSLLGSLDSMQEQKDKGKGMQQNQKQMLQDQNAQKHEVMKSLRRAWKPSLARLREISGPTFFTAFSFAEAADEVAELQAAGITLSIEPQLNPWASLAPRGVPLPAQQGALCKGPSPLWAELASDKPRLTRIAALEEDWLCANKVVFGCC